MLEKGHYIYSLFVLFFLNYYLNLANLILFSVFFSHFFLSDLSSETVEILIINSPLTSTLVHAMVFGKSSGGFLGGKSGERAKMLFSRWVHLSNCLVQNKASQQLLARLW